MGTFSTWLEFGILGLSDGDAWREDDEVVDVERDGDEGEILAALRIEEEGVDAMENTA